MEREVRYCTTEDGVSIAYCEAGEGTPFIELQPPPWSNIEIEFREWEWHRIMASRRRLIRFDHRGSGSSQAKVADYSVGAMALDIAAVADVLGLDQFTLFAEQWAGPVAIAYAARHPDRVSHLILYDGVASAQDFFDAPRLRSLMSLLDQGDWELFTDSFALESMGWDLAGVARDLGAFARGSVTLDEAQRFFAEARRYDVTALLPRVRAPTLVMQARGSQAPNIDTARRLAAAIPGAQLRILESDRHWSNAMEPLLLAALDEFIGDGDRATAEKVAPHVERITDTRALVAVLFTDLVGHTQMMQRLGDEKGREVLREHERIIREVLKAHGGTEVKTMGDGFLASFGSVTKAVECAVALQSAFARRNQTSVEQLNVRIGLNAGEPIGEDGDLFGSTVILAARLAAAAEGGEVLASLAVRELCSGKGFLFADRGEFVAKGFEDPVRISEVNWRHTTAS